MRAWAAIASVLLFYALAWGLVAGGVLVAVHSRASCASVIGLLIAVSIVYALFPRRRQTTAPGILVRAAQYGRLLEVLDGVEGGAGRARREELRITLRGEGDVIRRMWLFLFRGERVLILEYGWLLALPIEDLAEWVRYLRIRHARLGWKGAWIVERQAVLATAVDHLDSDDGYVGLVRRLLQIFHDHLTAAAQDLIDQAGDEAGAEMARRVGGGRWNQLVSSARESRERMTGLLDSQVIPWLRRGHRVPLAEAYLRLHPTEGGSGPSGEYAFELLEDRDSVEVALLRAELPDLDVVGARRVEPGDLEAVEVLDRWKEVAAAVRDLVNGRSLGDLPSVHTVVRESIPELVEEGELPESALSAPVAHWLGAAVAVALVREGWTVETAGDSQAFLRRAGDRLDPFDLVSGLEAGGDGEADVAGVLARLGIASIPFVAPSKARR